MSLKYFLIFTISSILLTKTFQLNNFSFTLDKSDRMCLHEYLSDKTLVIYEIYSDTVDIRYTITNPDGEVLFDKQNTKQFKESFTTYSGGYFEICLNNSSNESAKIDFDMKHGVAAKDYSSVVKSKDLKPMELDLQKLDDKSKEISHLIAFVNSHEKVYENVFDRISSKVTMFSGIIIASMIIVGLIETFYLKKFLTSRKLA